MIQIASFLFEKGDKMKLNVVNLGKMEYKEALDLQFELLEKRQNNIIDDTLLIVEHPHVITLGRNAKRENVLFSDEYLAEHGVEIMEINRGGDVTYHGPGQIVGYPIVNIKEQKLGVKDFVDKIEQVIIDLLHDRYDIDAKRDDINNGVWVDDEKITAVGFAVKKWVTMHGFALNVNTDLTKFNLIVPCGIQSRTVTTMEKIKKEKIDIERVKDELIEYFTRDFKYENVRYTNIDELEV